MVEISNIDAIIELILREAREVKGNHLVTRAYMVLTEVNNKLGEILRAHTAEERREKDDRQDRTDDHKGG